MKNYLHIFWFSSGLKFFQAGLAVLFYIVLARSLSIEDYGEYIYIISVVEIIATICIAGSPQLCIKNVPSMLYRNDYDGASSFITAAQTRSIVNGFLFLFPLCFLIGGKPESIGKLAIVTALAFFLILSLCQLGILKAYLLSSSRLYQGQIVDPSLRTLLAIFFVAIYSFFLPGQISYLDALMAVAISAAISTVIAFTLCRDISFRFLFRRSKTVSIMFKGAIYILVVNLSQIALRTVDIILLRNLNGPESAGICQVAYRIADICEYGLMIVNVTLGAQLALKIRQNIMSDALSIYKKAIFYSVLWASCFSLIMLLFGKHITQLFGNGYAEAYGPMLIILASKTLCTLYGPSLYISYITGKERYAAKVVVFMLLINIVLDFFLIPRFGVEGAAVATGISFFFGQTLIFKKVWSDVLRSQSILPAN